MKTFLYVFLLLLMYSTACPAQDSEVITSSYKVADSTKYKINILEKGDEFSFSGLYYIHEYDFVKILPYALIMSEIHKIEKYDLFVYEGLFAYLENDESIDLERTDAFVKLALYYLKKVLNTHNFSARLQLASFYKEGKYVDKNEAAAEYLYNGGYDIDTFLAKQKE